MFIGILLCMCVFGLLVFLLWFYGRKILNPCPYYPFECRNSILVMKKMKKMLLFFSFTIIMQEKVEVKTGS